MDAPTPHSSPTRIDWLITILLGALALAGSVTYRQFDHDDAYITYRYARNLAQGYGLVYNIGEQVLGTSTPLYAGLLALGSLASGQPVHWVSHVIGGLSLWLGSVAFYHLSKSQGRFLAASVAGLYVSHPLTIIATGMETLFLNLLIMTVLIAYRQRRFWWTGIGLGLLVLTRYEIALLVGLLGVHFILRYRRWPTWLVSTSLLVMTWLIFAYLTYGNVLPQSAVAKLIAPRIPFWLGALVWWHIYAEQIPWFNLTWVLVALGSYALIRRIITGQTLLVPYLMAWSGMYGLALSLFAGSFPWYYGPLIPGLAVLITYGGDIVRRALQLGAEYTPILRRSAASIGYGLNGLLVSGLIVVHVMLWRNQLVVSDCCIVDKRVVAYREVADWLNLRAPSEATLATAEIGALGYYSPLRIIDLLGLVTPDLTQWLDDGEAETIRQALILHQPDYILIHDSPEFRASLTDDYQLTQRFGENAEYLLYTHSQP